jgi:hypothetical protein
MRSRIVIVVDKVQDSYCCLLAAPAGRDFYPGFRPDLTPEQMPSAGL